MSANDEPFEVYQLVNGKYKRQVGEPMWMPKIGLGNGREIGTHDRCRWEWLYWYDEQGKRFLTPDERAEQLIELLRERGIGPETLS